MHIYAVTWLLCVEASVNLLIKIRQRVLTTLGERVLVGSRLGVAQKEWDRISIALEIEEKNVTGILISRTKFIDSYYLPCLI